MNIRAFFSCLAAVAASALISVLPIYHLPLGLLSFIALVPLLFCLDPISDPAFTVPCVRARLKTAFFWGYVFGACLFSLTFFWLWKVQAWFALFAVLYQSVFTGVFFLAVAYCRIKLPRFPFLVLVPLWWVVLEYVRGTFFLAFPAVSLCYMLGEYPVLIQAARYIGPYGISLVIAVVNVLLYRSVRYPKKALSALCVCVFLVAALYGYGLVVMQGPGPAANSITLAAVQGHIPKDIHDSFDKRFEVFETYGSLAKETRHASADLIVFPEATIPGDILDPRGKDIRRFYRTVAIDANAYLLTGGRHVVSDGSGERIFNAAYLFNPGGDIEGIYHKLKLVPFFEYVPFSAGHVLLNKLFLRNVIFSSGSEFTVFTTSWGRFSACICFEALFPALTRNFVQQGAQAIINISNDVDLGDTGFAHRNTSAMVLFRAIETHRYIVKCNRYGEGFIADPRGVRIARLAHGQPGTMIGTINLYDDRTCYVRWGFLLPPLLLAFALGLLLYSSFQTSQSPSTPRA